MDHINDWYKTITKNEIQAYNKVSSRDLALCVNFLQLPDTSTIVITVSVMKNKIKKNSLHPSNFCKIMSCFESNLLDVKWNQDTITSNEYYFSSVTRELTDKWYIQLCCHRVFFIPSNCLWDVIKTLFKQQNIQLFKDNNITEVSVFINTEDYDCNARFY